MLREKAKDDKRDQKNACEIELGSERAVFFNATKSSRFYRNENTNFNAMENETVTLFRPTGPRELELVKQSSYKKWPPRLPEQPIFYPVTNEEYAAQIARDWNVSASGSGFVTRFRVKKSFMDRYQVQNVGGAIHTEWWILAEDLEEMNANIVGEIEVIQEFY